MGHTRSAKRTSRSWYQDALDQHRSLHSESWATVGGCQAVVVAWLLEKGAGDGRRSKARAHHCLLTARPSSAPDMALQTARSVRGPVSKLRQTAPPAVPSWSPPPTQCLRRRQSRLELAVTYVLAAPWRLGAGQCSP
eukprot:2035625-Rhodomonas_salina.8